MKIEIQKGPRPALKTVIRRSQYSAIREAIDLLKPGQWFEIPGTAGFEARKKTAIRNVVHSHVRKSNGVLSGIEVSEATDTGALIVFSVSDPTKATRK